VIQAYRIPAQGTKDYYAVDMVSRILSSGESSRLYRALVDEQQKALFVGNFPMALEDPGVSLSFGITNMGVDVLDLEKSIDTEIAKVQNELISEKEYEKLRNQIESEYVTSNSRVAGIAESLATYYMFFGDANLINNEIDRYLAVTREDIQAAAKKYLVKDNRVTLHYLPKSQESKS
jgi:predicted Zn-dependent peptidase